MVDVIELQRIALAVREILEEAARKTSDPVFRNFPRGTCGLTAELLGRYLIEGCQLDPHYVAAGLPDGGSHAWLTIDGIIVDITADQFGEEPVIVASRSRWHEQLEPDAPRQVICSPDLWPAYPFSIWRAIVEGMTVRGFPAPKPRPDIGQLLDE